MSSIPEYVSRRTREMGIDTHVLCDGEVFYGGGKSLHFF